MTLAIAHRGDPIRYRENTLVAFSAAVEAGADMVELDCRLTKDGEVVVVHDPTLKRLWGLDRAVSDLDANEVACLGEGDQRIPTLAAVLRAVEVPLMVDVDDPRIMPAALAQVEAAQASSRCLFAGNLEGLLWLRKNRPDARIALSWSARELPSSKILEVIHPEYFNPRFDLINDSVVHLMHEMGYGVSVWTVDGESTMRRLLEMGVDAIITNRIATLVGLLGRDGSASAGPKL
jgi:glycerophosphoryl diester phosphodiesterase